MSPIKISKCKYVLHYICELPSHRLDFLKSVTSDTIHIVLDTNILLHHLRILKNLVEDIVAASAPITLICPGIVLNELDLYVSHCTIASSVLDSKMTGTMKPEKPTSHWAFS
jgi:hypothetical protein